MAFSYGTRTYGGSSRVVTLDDFTERFGTPSESLELEILLDEVPDAVGGEKVSAPITLELELLMDTMPTTDIGTVHDINPILIGDSEFDIQFNFDRNVRPVLEGPSRFVIDQRKPRFIVERAFPWYDEAWVYRRVLHITAPPSGLEAEHPIEVYLSKNINRQNKARSDYADIIVGYLLSNCPEEWRILPHSVQSIDQSQFRVRFDLVNAIEAGTTSEMEYFVYYGNPELRRIPPTGSRYRYDNWPIVITPSDDGPSFTRPGEDWENGTADKRLATTALKFYGPQVRVFSSYGPDQGILEIQIDNNPWEQIDLHDFSVRSDILVYEKRGLQDDDLHTLRLRVSGEKNPLSKGIGVNFTQLHYLKHNLADDIREEANRKLSWQSVLGGVV